MILRTIANMSITGASSTDIFMLFTIAKQIRMAHSIYDILRTNTFVSQFFPLLFKP